MHKVKYVHFLWRNETKFNINIVKLVNEELDPERKNHLFVTPHQSVYDSLTKYDNIVLDQTKRNLFNKYAPFCDWIFSHSTMNLWSVLGMSGRSAKKVILRTWGGSFGCQYREGQFIRNLLKKFINHCYSKKINSFAAIGIAKRTDIISMQGKVKNNRFYTIPYTSLDRENILIQEKQRVIEKDSVLNVALYHRGTKEGNHIEILKKLEHLGNKIRIYVPLSYGDKEYIEKVKSYIKDNCSQNVIVVDEFMEYEEYVAFTNRMDIAVFDCKTSTALGNIAVYLFLEKKIILNRNGVIKKAFDEEDIPHGYVDELETISYEDFAKMPDYPEGVHYSMMPLGREKSLSAWQEVLSDFN